MWFGFKFRILFGYNNFVFSQLKVESNTPFSETETVVPKEEIREVYLEYEKKLISLDKIKEYARSIIKGKSSINRLSLSEEQGRIEGGKRNVEASNFVRESKRTGSEAEQSKQQEQDLEEYAKKEGIGVPDYKTKFGEEIDKGSETAGYYDRKEMK